MNRMGDMEWRRRTKEIEKKLFRLQFVFDSMIMAREIFVTKLNAQNMRSGVILSHTRYHIPLFTYTHKQ